MAGTSLLPLSDLSLTEVSLPVWFWTQVIAMGMVIGCVLSPSFGIFTTFRTLQGLFGTVPQVIGLPIIYDMYHHRDWPRMINIWGTTFLVGPFVGPAIAGYVLYGTGKWVDSFGVLAGLYGASTLAIIVFGRETYYVKNQGTQEMPRWKSFLGLGNTGTLNKLSTVVEQSKDLFVMIFTLPMLLVGKYSPIPHIRNTQPNPHFQIHTSRSTL